MYYPIDSILIFLAPTVLASRGNSYTAIGPFSFLLWKRRTIVLQFRKFLQKHGVINPMSKCDYEALAATLCLEQTQAIHYYAHTEEGNELGNIAGNVKLSMLLLILFLAYYASLIILVCPYTFTGFFFADFPYVDNNCRFQLANLFAVDIDLDTKRFVKAKIDDELLTAKETVILLWFNTSMYPCMTVPLYLKCILHQLTSIIN